MMPQVALDGNTNVPIVFPLWSPHDARVSGSLLHQSASSSAGRLLRVRGRAGVRVRRYLADDATIEECPPCPFACRNQEKSDKTRPLIRLRFSVAQFRCGMSSPSHDDCGPAARRRPYLERSPPR
jgi:hypothetical protein